ncbi:MAG: DUF4340 domain-containing protein [Pirellulales bacterium]|nr:DUF4340 domain-containing protein [Pirellulales bacterium]
MSQEIKTFLFLVVAFVSAIIAFAMSREAPEKTAADLVGESLVEIEDPLEVARMRIVEFDPSEGQSVPFEVAKIDGLFSIPSHENHPADQSDHLVDAVTGVNYTKILSSATDEAGHHDEFGVRDPASSGLGRGAEGVGKRITFSSKEGEPLADFIIGKKVVGAEGQYYVRQANNDQVYTVSLDPTSLSTRFEDWIERDVLQFDPLELTDVGISDYTVLTQQQLVPAAEGLQVVTVVEGLDMKADIQLEYDQRDLEWKLKDLIVFDEGKPRKEIMADDQQLNKARLEAMKEALDDLRVVDVRRKPTGLGDSLSAFVQSSPGAAESLEEHGFYFRQIEGSDGGVQNVLLSNHGEINIGMADGLRYVLRFGNVAGRSKEDSSPEGRDPQENRGAANAETEEPAEAGRALRNLMVVTRFDPKLLESPEYAEVPPEQPPTATENTAAEEAAASEDEEAESDQATDGPLPVEEEKAEAVDSPQETDPDEWRLNREAILAENARKQQAYQEKIAAGKERSAKLNRRFADWYYVISDATYQEIHLTAQELLEKKPPAADATIDGATFPAGGSNPLDQLRNLVPPQSSPEN